MKRALVWFVIFALCLALPILPSAQAETPSDIIGHPFQAQIQWMLDQGKMSVLPDGSFHPEELITRAQFAIDLALWFGLTTSGYTAPSYSDVPLSHSAFGSIEAVHAQGWMEGFPDGGFHPDAPLSREDLAFALVRAIGRQTEAASYTEAFVDANDCAAVSAAAYGAVTVAYHTDVQLLNYRPGRMIAPQEGAKQGEAALAGYRVFNPPTKGGQLVIGMAQEPTTLYPYLYNMGAKSQIMNCLMNSWIGLAPEGEGTDQKAVYYPIFACEVPSTENGLVQIYPDQTMTVTWRLRQTPIYWEDGVPFSLDDAIFGHEVLVNAAIPADSRRPEDLVTAIEKVDEHTLRLAYSEVNAEALFGPPTSLAKHKYEASVNADPANFPNGEISQSPLSNGPYRVQSWSAGAMTLQANANFCFGSANIKTLIWKFIPNSSEIYNRLASGELDLSIPGIGVATTTAINNRNAIPGIIYEIHPSTYIEHIEFNLESYNHLKHPIFNPPDNPEAGRKVRQAIAYALNREQASQQLFQGYEPPAFSMIPPAVAVCFATKEEIGLNLIPTYNPTYARQLLDEAGWLVPGGSTDGVRQKDGQPLEIQLSTTNRTDRQQMGAIWQQNLADVGIKLNLNFKSVGVFFVDTWCGSKRGYPDMVQFSWGSMDPRFPVTAVFRGDRVAFVDNTVQGQNYCGYQNAAFDQADTIINSTLSPATAHAAAILSQQILLQDMPAVPLLYTADACLYRDSIIGVQDPNWSAVTWNLPWWTGGFLADDQWTQLPLYGGYVNSLIIDPNNPQTLYAGTGDGVFKSTNSGASWIASSGGLPNSAVPSLAVDRNNSQTLYAGTQGAGLFKSTNGGVSWASFSNGLTDSYVECLVIDPNNSQILYAGTADEGVLKSTDGGNSWVSHWSGNSYVECLAIDPNNPQTLYAGTGGEGAFKSTNGGASWVFSGWLMNGYVLGLAIDPNNSQTLYAGTGGAGLFKSTDGGASWASSSGLISPGVECLAIDPNNSQILYAGTVGAGLFKSTDGGASWVSSSGLTNGYVECLAIDPNNSQIVYAGTGGGGLCKSSDGGTSWTASSSGLTNSDVRSLVTDPNNSQILYAGTWGGVFKSSNGGMSWASSSSGLMANVVPCLAVDPLNSQTLYAGTLGGGVFKSSDGGASWASSSGELTNSNVQYLAIDPNNSQILYAGTGGGVFKSTSSGTSWFSSSDGLTNNNVRSLAIDPNNSQILYAGTGGGVFKSTSSGTSWFSSSDGLTNNNVRSLAIDPNNPQILYAGTGSGVFKSINGGASWASFSSGLPNIIVYCLAIDPNNPQILYAGSGGRGAWKWNPGPSFIPRFTNLPASRVVHTGTPFSFTAEASDDAGGSLAFSIVSGACSGMTINSATGVIFWPSPSPGDYRVQVGVTNGTALVTAVLSLSVPGSGPGRPTSLLATASNQSVSLTWNPAPPGLYPLAGYFVYRGLSPGGEGSIPLNSAPLPSISYTDGAVQNGQTYYYLVRAVDTAVPPQLGSPSDEAVATPQAPPVTPPGRPASLLATAGDQSVSLTWTAASPGTLPLGGYRLYRSLSSGSNYELRTTVPASSQTFIDTGLTNGTSYFYQVAAFDASTPPLEGSCSPGAQATPMGSPLPAPNITTLFPNSNASGVSRQVQPSATFNLAMDPGRFAGNFLLVKLGTGQSVAGSIQYNPSLRKVTFIPNSPPEASTTYQATIRGGPFGVRSSAGQPLASDASWSFSVEAIIQFPDLAITSANIRLAPQSSGSTQVTATVRNLGPATASNVQVRFQQAGGLDQTVSLSGSFPAGTSKDAVIATTLQPGKDLNVTVDPNNQIQEVTKSNNLASCTVPPAQPATVSTVTADFEGTFLPGITVYNVFHAQVSSSLSNPVIQVRFTLDSNQVTDSTAADGWSASFDMGSLSPGKHQLSVVAVTQYGQNSAPFTRSVEMFQMPAWLTILTTIPASFHTELDRPNKQVKYVFDLNFDITDSWQLRTLPYVDGRTGNDFKFLIRFWFSSNGSGSGSYRLTPLFSLFGSAWKGGPEVGGTLTFGVNRSVYPPEPTLTIQVNLGVNLNFNRDFPILWGVSIWIPVLNKSLSFGIFGHFNFDFSASQAFILRPSTTNPILPHIPLAIDVGNWSTEFKVELGLAADIVVARVEGGGYGVGGVDGQWQPFRITHGYLQFGPYVNVRVLWYSFPHYWSLFRKDWPSSTEGQYSFNQNKLTQTEITQFLTEANDWSRWQPLSRSYLDSPDYTAFHGNSPYLQSVIAEYPLLSNINPDAQPNIVTTPTGGAWVLFAHDDPSKPQPSCYKIAWSQWNGSSWSPLQLLEDTDYPEFSPVAARLGTSGALALWTRVPTTTLTPSFSPEQVFPLADLAWSTWTGTGWSTPQMLTNDGQYTFGPALASAPDGSLWAAWATDKDNNLGTLDRAIYAAHFQGGAWSPIETVSPSLPYDGGGLALTVRDGEPLLTWVEDTDGNPETLYDRQLSFSKRSSGNWSAPAPLNADPSFVQSPALTRGPDGLSYLAYVRTPSVAAGADPLPSEIALCTWDGATWSEKTTIVQGGKLQNPVWTKDSLGNLLIVWEGSDSLGNQCLLYSFKLPSSSSWSAVRQLTTLPGISWQKSIALLPDDRLITADIRINQVETPSGLVGGPSDLCIHLHTLASEPGLLPGSLTWTPTDPSPGTDLTVTATVGNFGDQLATNVQVSLFDGDPASGGVRVAGPQTIPSLAPDQTMAVSFSWTCPAAERTHTGYLVVNEGGPGQAASFSFLLPDIQIPPSGLQLVAQGSSLALAATFNNIGWTTSPTLPIKVYDGDPLQGAPLLVSTGLPPIKATATCTLNWSWTPTDLIPSPHTFWVLVDPEGSLQQRTSEGKTVAITGLLGPDIHPASPPMAFSSDQAGPLQVLIALENRGLAANNVPIALYTAAPTRPDTTPAAFLVVPELTGSSTTVVALPFDAPVGTTTFWVWIDPQMTVADVDQGDHLFSFEANFIPAAGSLSLLSPNGGENWAVGRSYGITWTASNISGNLRIDLSRDGGMTWAETIVDSAPVSTGSSTWAVNELPSSTCRVKLTSLDNPSVFDVSDRNFAILILPSISSTPSSFTFSCTRSQANPPPQTLEVWNSGGSTLNWTASEGAGWLSLNPTSGSSTGEHDPITLSVDASGLVAGMYTATIILAATGADNSPQSVGVTLTVHEPLPRIGYSPSSFTFSCTRGQANPSPQTLEVWNSSGGTLNWTADEGAGWLSLTPTAGSSTGEHDPVTVSVDASGLGAGTYTATITLAAAGADNSPQQVPVNLTIKPQSPVIAFTPSLFTFTATAGEDNPADQILTLWNGGEAPLNWTVAGSEDWLTLLPIGGSNDGSVAVGADTTGLAAGTYSATITITAPSAGNSPQQIPVTLTLVPATITLNFNLVAGWNMISLPVTPSSTDPNVVFGGLPSGWVIYAWDAANGRYIGKDQIMLGLNQGFWLKVSRAAEYPVSGQANEAAQTTIDLGLGWNLIGVPYEGAIPWGAIRVSQDGGALVTLDQAIASNWIQNTFYRWQGNAYQGLTTGGVFQPLSGYWVKTKTAGVRLVFVKP